MGQVQIDRWLTVAKKDRIRRTPEAARERGQMRLRRLRVGWAFLFAASGLIAAAANPGPAAAVACDSFVDNKFLGNARFASGMKGVYSEIEYINKTLCAQPFPPVPPVWSWALDWVSLDGPQSSQVPGVDIFQGGYAKCPSSGTCPYNAGATYIWYYYGHEQGACGLAFNTGIIKIQNATSGLHFFQISRVGSRYDFYYDEVEKTHVSQADVETCWPGVAAVEWQNEMLNNGDQGGGGLANRQDFKANQYQNATGWHPMNRTLGSLCDANSYPAHWHCRTSSTIANNSTSWDDRFP